MLDDFYQGVNPYTGLPETEEERRKRLGLPALNDVVTSTEVKTYGDGTSEQITKQTIPAQPAQPVAGPVSPQDVYGRMIQAESGGRDFNAQGQPLTSPKGAMFRGQVMPSTAANPGFGVRPAQSQTPEEYNRVGEEYYQALLKKYNGNQQLAVAAYNMGPGAVDRNLAQNQGQFNVAQAPKETQGYLDKVLGGVKTGVQNVINAVIPSAQAGEPTPEQIRQQALAQRQTPPQPTAPAAAPVAPTAQPGAQSERDLEERRRAALAQSQPTAQPAAPVQRPSLATPGIAPEQPMLGQGLTMPGQPQPVVTRDSTQAINVYQQAQDNPEALLKIRADANTPAFIRERAGARAYELLDAEQKKKQAEAQAQQLTQLAAQGDRRASLTVAKELQNQEGSYLKMILLSYLSPELAGEEAIKLGFGNKWETAYDKDGNPGLVEVSARGRPLRGTKADGSEMSKTELIQYAAGTGGKKAHEMPQTLGSPVVKEIIGPDGNKQQIGGIRMWDPRSRTTYVQVGNQRMPDVDWVTTGQAPGAVYGAGYAREAGSQAAQGYTPPAGPGVPGAPAQRVAPTQAAPAQPTAPTQAAPTQAAPAPAAVSAPVAPTTTPPLTGPAAQKSEAERKSKEREAVVKSNQEFGDALFKSRQSAVAQTATIDRIQTAIDKNPEFWGIDTNSTAWRAFVDLNSTNEKRAEALNTLARNINIPKEKRAEFDQVMNDYRNLQVNSITASGLTASQTNSEKESQRVVNQVGSISDRPAAAKATLEYAKAKIAYTDAKAKAWSEYRKRPGADYTDFELEFDRTQGEKIFADANKRIESIIGGQPGPGTGTTSSGNRFKRVQ